MVHLTHSIIEKQKAYKYKLDEAVRNGIPAAEFKKYSGAMGVYPQKKNGGYMIRPRIYSGIISLAQLRLLAQLAADYTMAPLHLTTRQSFQIHHVDQADTWPIIEKLLNSGIITVGAGGNSIRNISIPPLAGVDPNEIFDVTPYAVAATEYALSLKGMAALPRKYKIAFSGDDRDIAKTRISDLGFIATLKDGIKGFEVYGGGGGGSNPALAVQLSSFVRADTVLKHIGAMKRLFEEHGDRQNRNTARIRYIVKRLGKDAFVKLYQDYLKAVWDETPFLTEDNLQSFSTDLKPNSNGTLKGDNISVFDQLQSGYYALYLHPSKGDLQQDDLHQIMTLVEDSNGRIDIRLASTQGLYLRNMTLGEVQQAQSVLGHLMPGTPFERSVSCTGAKNCFIGLRDSQGLLEALKVYHDSLTLSDRHILPEIRISGCRNGCSLHQFFGLGFEGAAIRENGVTVPAYRIYLGGKAAGSDLERGEALGLIAEKDIPELLGGFVDLVNENGLRDFDSLYETHPEKLKMLITKYGR